MLQISGRRLSEDGASRDWSSLPEDDDGGWWIQAQSAHQHQSGCRRQGQKAEANRSEFLIF